MRITVSALLISTLVLGGCATVRDSRMNPFNWFGQGRSEAVETTAESTNPLIPSTNARGLLQRREVVYGGTPVDTVRDMAVERVPGGALIRVTGIATRQGSYDVALVKDDTEEDPNVLSFSLMAVKPGQATAQGGERSREVNAAIFLTDQQLEGISTIRVKGARNQQVSRR